ncbi:hypothetical protein [Vibrio coralliilyticus]|uniref:hypothetical protein n=1 Tax=Vibrio coralliilyticus TaxID=190893 RepID=UPI0002E78D93|nr:hypothetical protein [Vibrio coralliilyticus]
MSNLKESKCNWDYKVIVTGNPDANAAENYINEVLNESEKATFKIAQDDRRSESAHTVIFFDKNGQNYERYTGPYAHTVLKCSGTSSDQLKVLCKDAIDFLNSLSDLQSINARVTLSNSQNPTEILTIYYPLAV